jgi:rSAM-associated Gly-rich repeat protein
MSAKERTSKALALLIPTGVIGISSALATVQAQAEPIPELANAATPVAERLSEIRSAVSGINKSVIHDASGARLVLADWLNFGVGWPNGGWRNGGWGNGGWGNGGWHNWGNGWHNGWGNGGWHNWHNFWHNW